MKKELNERQWRLLGAKGAKRVGLGEIGQVTHQTRAKQKKIRKEIRELEVGRSAKQDQVDHSVSKQAEAGSQWLWESDSRDIHPRVLEEMGFSLSHQEDD